MKDHTFHGGFVGFDSLYRVLENHGVTHHHMGFHLNQVAVQANRVTDARHSVYVIAGGDHVQNFLVWSNIREGTPQQTIQQFAGDVTHVIRVANFLSGVQRGQVAAGDTCVDASGHTVADVPLRLFQ